MAFCYENGQKRAAKWAHFWPSMGFVVGQSFVGCAVAHLTRVLLITVVVHFKGSIQPDNMKNCFIPIADHWLFTAKTEGN